MVKLTDLLKEIIDIYSPEELTSKDIDYVIYDYYFRNTKHFPDFKNTQEKIGDATLQIWTKK